MNLQEHNRSQDLDEVLDRALDALAAEGSPDNSMVRDPEYLDLVDTARVVRALRPPSYPDETFAARLSEYVVQHVDVHTPVSPSSNGYYPNVPGTLVPLPRRRLHRTRVLLVALLRTLGSGVLAGILVGVLVGGVGGRLVMYISGQMYLHQHPGAVIISESSSQAAGTFSWSGTIDLLIEGMFSGAVVGIFYVAVRRWLPGSARWHGAAFGLFLLLVAGSMTISSANRDFSRIGSAWINVGMFAMLFLLFGILVAPITERIDRWFTPARVPQRQSPVKQVAARTLVYPLGAFGLLVSIALILTVLVFAGVTIASIAFGDVSGPGLLGFATAVLVIVILPVASALTSPVAVAMPIAGGLMSSARQATLTRVARIAFRLALGTGLILMLYNVIGILTVA